MELEEMKAQWQQMSAGMEKQKSLTDTLIIKMTQLNYRDKLNKILIPETIGALVCFAAILFILTGLQSLNTPYLLVCGIVSAVILFVMPVLSLKAVYNIRSVNIISSTYSQSLARYAKAKLQFVFVKKLSFCLGALLMLAILPVMGKLISHVDLFKNTNLWYWYVIMFPFFYWFATWVFKYYNKTVAGAEDILKELAD